MIKYILKRIFYMAISLVIITTITFFLMKLMPGSPFNDAKLSPDQKYILNEKYGLNDPIPIQYLNYMKNVFTGDFGYSFQYHNQPVWDIIKPRLIPSLEMGITAMIIGMLIGLILGVASAAKQNTWIDYLATIISVLAVSVPSFVLAVILQFVFAVKLRWFPVAGWKVFQQLYSLLLRYLPLLLRQSLDIYVLNF
ncbi:nickel ABC transporter [Staphylococcus aureus]|nr:nickel ABC transporter [Staphylococcus aureus]